MVEELVACPRCACHARPSETKCPSCGEPLRRADGTVPRTAVAVLLGLAASAAAVGGCTEGATPSPSSSSTATASSSTGAEAPKHPWGGYGGTAPVPAYGTATVQTSTPSNKSRPRGRDGG